MIHPIQSIIEEHKQKPSKGIYSVCSANPFVLQAAMLQAKEDHSPLLIEATSNQVDQFGGYTGMTPEEFYNYAMDIADETDFDRSKLILGGDHLGPNVWQQETADLAMKKAYDQIQAYVHAGFTKIHLDASMALGNVSKSGKEPLEPELVAQRTAELCRAAEDAWQNSQAALFKPVYIIGTDVPIPGGAEESLENIHVTPVREVKLIIALTRDAFHAKGLEDAWQRVVAVVVQPGVEFSGNKIDDYKPSKETDALKKFISQSDQSQFVYEAHSTDYQMSHALKQMVQDHLAILKVGPWLTFALREAVFSLAAIEDVLAPVWNFSKSPIIESIEQEMQDDPKYWDKHYLGDEQHQAFDRKYSLSDRIRYYWPCSSVKGALKILVKNLKQKPIPLSLLSQYLPVQYQAVRSGQLKNNPVNLIHHKIREVLGIYSSATE